ncbi:hypothetical protein [Streptomyces olivochromogenes]|uniref:hypothetical protein n=1 Tax=Streptomyces olivochromogenes TaxID=1963 RepID=UPI001F278D68|nr:hypothetical protein [Streptomyces olivochromogenes]MCF3131732.1 hypothetical protein [Streptomyces olivochromogenes]
MLRIGIPQVDTRGGAGRYLLVGFGFDDNSRGPSVTDMQWITEGIERLDGGGSGSGTSA